MANEKNINSRIQHKHDTEANWQKATNFIPKTGEIIIYDVDNNFNAPRIKIGDGVTTVVNLPFLDSEKKLYNLGHLNSLYTFWGAVYSWALSINFSSDSIAYAGINKSILDECWDLEDDREWNIETYVIIKCECGSNADVYFKFIVFGGYYYQTSCRDGVWSPLICINDFATQEYVQHYVGDELSKINTAIAQKTQVQIITWEDDN